MKSLMFFAVIGWLAGISVTSQAADAGSNPAVADEKRRASGEGAQWAFSFENDVLAAAKGDKDYTLGLNLTYTGRAVKDFKYSPYPLQRWLDERLGWSAPEPRDERHSLEIGVYGFTPDDIMMDTPIADDRPYASLIYLESTRERIDVVKGVSWTSSLSIGLLGLDAVGSVQNNYHESAGKNPAAGWQHQVSDGGELTAKYMLARERFWDLDNPAIDLKSTTTASLGYITEASYGISFRAGQLHSGWWSFDPELATYGENSIPSAGVSRVPERYVWGGVTVKARLYNVFLQGQFRDSAHTFDADQLHHLLLEVWLGYTHSFDNGLRLSYVLRGHSSEIRSGDGDRPVIWGGLIFSKAF